MAAIDDHRGRAFALCPACRRGRAVHRKTEEFSMMTGVGHSDQEVASSAYRAPVRSSFFGCSACPMTWKTSDALTAAWISAGRPTRKA